MTGYEPEAWVTKDSGKREEYASGMVRDVQDGKPRYDLIDEDFLERWASLMERGAQKYGEDNWRLANSVEEWSRFRASANRHFRQWSRGDTDEDHASAVAYNLAACAYVEAKLKEQGYTLKWDHRVPVWMDPNPERKEAAPQRYAGDPDPFAGWEVETGGLVGSEQVDTVFGPRPAGQYTGWAVRKVEDDECGEFVSWWSGEYEGNCELTKGHGGAHFDGSHWYDDEGDEVYYE